MEGQTRRARVVHTIAYRLDEEARGAGLVLRLGPRALADQRVDHHQILIEPRPATMAIDEDDHGNVRRRVEIGRPFRALVIEAVSTVARVVSLDVDLRAAASELLARAGVSPADPAFTEPPRGGREACRLRAEEALARLRARDIACRYVAGYPWPERRGPVLPHAWISVLVPGRGFVEFDPMRGEIAPGHVVLGWGDGYDDTAPVAGTLHASGRYRLSSTVMAEPIT